MILPFITLKMESQIHHWVFGGERIMNTQPAAGPLLASNSRMVQPGCARVPASLEQLREMLAKARQRQPARNAPGREGRIEARACAEIQELLTMTDIIQGRESG